MKPLRVSAISLSARDFPSFDAKMTEAIEWIEIARNDGTQLVVLPEVINIYSGDGEGAERRILETDDWKTSFAPLVEAAAKNQVAFILPVRHRENSQLHNTFFFIDETGQCIGRYDKRHPTQTELESGIRPMESGLIEWRGIKFAGAICFDTHFVDHMEHLAESGAEVFLVPSLWPGGQQLNYLCLRHSVRCIVAYPQWSRIIDIDGKEVIEGGYRNETLRFGFGVPVFTADLNLDRVALYADHNQKNIKAVIKKYGSRIKVSYVQENCTFYLDSLDPDLNEHDLLKEFDLIPRKTFFQQAKQRIDHALETNDR